MEDICIPFTIVKDIFFPNLILYENKGKHMMVICNYINLTNNNSNQRTVSVQQVYINEINDETEITVIRLII